MRLKHLLESIEYVEPGPITRAHLDKVPQDRRYIDLSSFKRTEDSMCGWCNAEKVTGKVRKYCGVNCRESAEMYCYPSSPQAKAWVFISRQNCTCLKCGEIFEDHIDDLIERRHKDIHQNWPKEWKKGPVEYWWLGKRIGHLWQSDHIVAICNGGRGIGLENIQVICNKCHYSKTASDVRVTKTTPKL